MESRGDKRAEPADADGFIRGLQEQADAVLESLLATGSGLSGDDATAALRDLRSQLPISRLGALNHHIERHRQALIQLPFRRYLEAQGLPASDTSVADLAAASRSLATDDLDAVSSYLHRLFGFDWWQGAVDLGLVAVLAQAEVRSLNKLEEWEQQGVRGVEVADWYRRGVRTPETVAAWRAVGAQTPQDIMRWRDADVRSPEDVRQWAEMGATSATAVKRWTRAGVSTPELAAEWKQAGYGPAEASAWTGRTPAEAESLRRLGVTPEQSKEIEHPAEALRPWMDAGFPVDLADALCAVLPGSAATRVKEEHSLGKLRQWQRKGLLPWIDTALSTTEINRRVNLGLNPEDPTGAFSRAALLTVVRNDVSGEQTVQVVLSHGRAVLVRGTRRADREAGSFVEALSSFPELVYLSVGERVGWKVRRQKDRQLVEAALSADDPNVVDSLDIEQQDIWTDWRYEQECGENWHDEVPATLDGHQLMAMQQDGEGTVLLQHRTTKELLALPTLVDSRWDSSTYGAVGNTGTGSYSLRLVGPGRYLELEVLDRGIQEHSLYTDARPVEAVVADYLRRSELDQALLRTRPDRVPLDRYTSLRETQEGDEFLLSSDVDEEQVLDLLLSPGARRVAVVGAARPTMPTVEFSQWEVWGHGYEDVKTGTLYYDGESGQYVVEWLIIREQDGYDMATGETGQAEVGQDLAEAACSLLELGSSRLVAEGWEVAEVCDAVSGAFVQRGYHELTINGEECRVVDGRLRPVEED